MSDGRGIGGEVKNNPVMVLSLLFVGAISLWALIDSQGITEEMEAYENYVLDVFDWAFMLFVSVFVVIVIAIAISKYGRLRLGKDDDKPEFSRVSWISMLFAAGMGSSLINYSVAEPVHHYIAPPGQEGLTNEAVRSAFRLTFLHWGLHPWAIYAVCSLIVAYFTFRKGTGTLVSAPIFYAFRGAIPKKPLNWICTGGEILAVVSVVCGLGGTLVFGILSVRAGMHYTVGTDIDSTQLSLLIMAVMTVFYLISASTSLDKGILIISNLNGLVTIILLALVFFLGPTSYILTTFVNSAADYFTDLATLSFLKPPANEEIRAWNVTWTLSYFMWWLAWGPFVGVFIARISRGRTIREFVLGVMLIPTVFAMFWFASFGGAGVFYDQNSDGVLSSIVYEDMTRGYFEFFEYLPATVMFQAVSTLLMFTYLVTSADSGTYVVSSMTSHGALNPSMKLKLLWGVIIAALTTGILLTGSWEASRYLAILGAIPFTIFVLLQLVAFFRVLPGEFADERRAAKAVRSPQAVPVAGND